MGHRMTETPGTVLRAILLVALVLGLAACGDTSTSEDPPPDGLGSPLDGAHAHNDYEHDRPLLDALAHGFTSVEVDVWLVDDELLVAHDRPNVDPELTMESLYLQPLADLVAENDGSVYPGWDGSLQLLIDVKSDAEETYAVIHQQLEGHAEILTRFEAGQVTPGAVTAVISGNRTLDAMEAQPVRFAGFDGRLDDLGSGDDASFIPLISDNWQNHFNWRGDGEFSEAEATRLADIVEEAHGNNQQVRFWATPDVASPERDRLWETLIEAGVDHINTDDLAGLSQFLSSGS